MPVVAFDNIEFKRNNNLGGRYYTPFGAAVKFRDEQKFEASFRKESIRLASRFSLFDGRYVRSASYLKYGVGLNKAVAFCDYLIQSIQANIESVDFVYVLLPPNKYPTIWVGPIGRQEELDSIEYMKNLSPMFSHILAWSFLGKPGGQSTDWDLQLDNFTSKKTRAWEDLSYRSSPRVYPHGDESNPFINVADILCFLSNFKLGRQSTPSQRKLNAINLLQVWNAYSFRVDVRYLNESIQRRIAWNSNDMIDLRDHIARPNTFVILDEDLKKPPPKDKFANEPAELSGVKAPLPKPPTFRERFERSEPGVAVANYAYFKRGGFQYFDKTIDEPKIKDGDTLTYAGPLSETLAKSYAHMYDITAMSLLELRKEVERMKSKVVN